VHNHWEEVYLLQGDLIVGSDGAMGRSVPGRQHDVRAPLLREERPQALSAWGAHVGRQREPLEAGAGIGGLRRGCPQPGLFGGD
jgi:hypothetical protein